MNCTASPYREMMAIVNRLPKNEFRLSVCSLRDGGFQESSQILKDLGVDSFVARFRPTSYSAHGILASLRDQDVIDSHGPFAIQHSLDFTSSPFEALMARWRSRIYLCSQRNLNQDGHSTLLKLKMRLCARVIGISDTVCGFLVGQGVPKRKIEKIYLGLGLSDIHAQRQRGLFVSVGHIEPLKRQHDSIQAIALLSKEFPEARLAIAGNVYDPIYLDYLKQLALELGVAEKVQFLGPRNDILHLLSEAHAVIHCCDREAFGWVVLEGMSVGTPVVACSAAGPREIIDNGRTGILVEKGDAKGYQAALRRLLTEDSLVKHLSSNGRAEVAERFSDKTMVEQICAVYRNCLQSRNTAFGLREEIEGGRVGFQS